MLGITNIAKVCSDVVILKVANFQFISKPKLSEIFIFINFSYFVTDSPKEGHTFKIDFQTLFNTLCKIVTIDQATLLLYLLLHRNSRFYRYAMDQENLQQMVIPILQTLYNAPDSTSHHIYMTLIVLLILSEDDGFNKCVHQIVSILKLCQTNPINNLIFCCLFIADIEEYSLVH